MKIKKHTRLIPSHCLTMPVIPAHELPFDRDLHVPQPFDKDAFVLRARTARLSVKLTPAPPRGRYDRHRSAQERDRDRLERLLTATALELCARGPERATVAGVVRRARMGRNSFYRHFPALGPAHAAARQQARRLVERTLERAEHEACTPLEQLRALGRAWLGIIADHPAHARLLLDCQRDHTGPSPNRVVAVLAAHLAPVLAAARQIGAASTPADSLRLEAIAGAWEAVGRACAERRADAETAHSLLVDLAVRAVR
jgi:AcrR family transcriptional regulator